MHLQYSFKVLPRIYSLYTKFHASIQYSIQTIRGEIEFKKLLIPHNGVKKIMQLHYSFIVLHRIQSSIENSIQTISEESILEFRKLLIPLLYVYCHKRQLTNCLMQLFSQQDGKQTCFTADSNDAVIIQYAKVLFDTILFYKKLSRNLIIFKSTQTQNFFCLLYIILNNVCFIKNRSNTVVYYHYVYYDFFMKQTLLLQYTGSESFSVLQNELFYLLKYLSYLISYRRD